MMNVPLANKALLGSDFNLIPRPRIIKELKGLPIKEERFHKLTFENPVKVLSLL